MCKTQRRVALCQVGQVGAHALTIHSLEVIVGGFCMCKRQGGGEGCKTMESGRGRVGEGLCA